MLWLSFITVLLIAMAAVILGALVKALAWLVIAGVVLFIGTVAVGAIHAAGRG